MSQEPEDNEAERRLVGAMLVGREEAAAVMAESIGAALSSQIFQQVYDAAVAVFERGHVPTCLTVGDEMRRPGAEADVARILTILARQAALLAEVPSLAAIVRRKAEARRAVGIGVELQEAGRSEDIDRARRVLAGAEEQLASVVPMSSSWEPVDLRAVFDDGLPSDVPTILARQDGQCLLYPGKVNGIAGEPESGKSWVALGAIMCCIEAGDVAVLLDFESDKKAILGRLRALGLGIEEIIEHFVYIRPEDPFDGAARGPFLAMVKARRPALVVVDGMGAVLEQNGWDENSNSDVVAFMNAIPRPLEREGCGVLLLDHLTKSKETQGNYPRGAGAKLAALSGAGYRMDKIQPFGRGRTGRSRLVVTKDRPGWVRNFALGGKLAAEIVVTSDERGEEVVLTISPPADSTAGAFRPTALMQRLSRALADSSAPMNQRELLAVTTGNRDGRLTALNVLVAEGYVEMTKAGQTNQYRSIQLFTETDTPTLIDVVA